MHEAFDSFDIDRSKSIDIDEAIKHWKKDEHSFAKISANEFFKAVDMDGNGEIDFNEFESFWVVVR